MNRVLIIDAQGGGLGRQLILRIRKEMPETRVVAVGTNTAATANMLKAGADEAATGENSVVVACRKADVIVGPIGIIMADSMLGEITAVMAKAVAQSEAFRILIPFNNCDTYIAGAGDQGITRLVDDAVEKMKKIIK